jgi:hypothetical protein
MQYRVPDSSIERRTAAVSMAVPVTSCTTSMHSKTCGCGSSRCAPVTMTSYASTSWRFFARMEATSRAVQPARAARSSSAGRGAVFPASSSTASSCPLPVRIVKRNHGPVWRARAVLIMVSDSWSLTTDYRGDIAGGGRAEWPLLG